MDIIELHEEKKEPKKYTVEEVLNSLYFEEVDSAGDYDGYLHITSTLDGNGTKIPFSDFTLQEQRHQEEMREIIECKSCKGVGGYLSKSLGYCECEKCGGDGHRLYDMEGINIEDIINKKLQDKI
jgi:hypothetical protein